MTPTDITPEEVERQLQRVLTSPAFARSRRLSEFLRFTVQLTVGGRAQEIKEHRIGAEVFERGPDFDPQTDTIVRTQAYRLRAALAAYYENEGRGDPVVIEFAKGSYVPAIREREPLPDLTAPAPPPAVRRFAPRKAAFAFALVISFAAGALTVRWFGADRPAEMPLSYVTIPLLAEGILNMEMGQTAISPGGGSLVFPLIENSGRRRLWLRRLGSMHAIALAGTEDGRNPFWSPDESEIGFFAHGMLKVFRLRDGTVRDLCEAPLGRGGSWSRRQVILFTPRAAEGQVHRISPAGGLAVPVTTLDKDRDESSHRWPEFLADGEHFIYTAQSRTTGKDGIWLASLGGGRLALLDPTFSQAHFARTRSGEYLLYVKEKSVRARKFNLAARRLEGPETTLVKGAYYTPFEGASFSVDGGRRLVYHSSRIQKTALVLFDRAGRVVRALGTRGQYEAIALSRDGRRLAAEIAPDEQSESDIWTGSADKPSFLRVTVGGGAQAVWSPDNRALTFVTPEDGFTTLRRQSLAEGAKPVVIQRSRHAMFPTDISPDGQFLAFHYNDPASQMDLMLLPLDPVTGQAAGEAIPVRRSRFNEGQGFFSPDGRYLAYFSGESGRQEVYVEALPPGQAGPERRWKISDTGGFHPRWRGDGRELFYLSHDRSLMSVTVTSAAGGLEFGAPRKLFTPGANPAGGRRSPMGVAPDGNSFYFLVSPAGSGFHEVSLVTGWDWLLSQRPQ